VVSFLLPYPWFFVAFAVSALLIFKTSQWLVESSVEIAEIFRLSKIAVGVILLAVLSAAPEVFIAIFSALRDASMISVGNVFGASLMDVTIVIGMLAVFGGTLAVEKREILRLVQFLFVISVIPVFILLRGGEITRFFGLILLTFFILYMYNLYRGEKKVMAEVEKEEFELEEEKRKRAMRFPLVATKFFGAFIALAVAASTIVDSTIQISSFIGVPATYIGITFVGFATALPELSIGIAAIRRKEFALALSDVLGGSITDMTLVLGMASVLAPTVLFVESIATVFPFLLISILTIWYLLSEFGKIEQLPGLVLIALYAGFLMEVTGITVVFSI